MDLFWKICRLAVPLALVITTCAATGQQLSPCDPHLVKDLENPYGYRERGDRCEGIYKRRVSFRGPSSLAVVSFTGPLQGIDTLQGQEIALEWKAPPGSGKVRLTADSLRFETFYRMDTDQPADKGRFVWSTAIASRYRMRTGEIGIVAYTQTPSLPQPLYLPLRVNSASQRGDVRPYRIAVVPTVRLKEVYWSLARLNAQQHRQYLVYERALQRQPYPPGVSAILNLSEATEPGYYCLSLGAEIHGGGSEALDVYFYGGAD